MPHAISMGASASPAPCCVAVFWHCHPSFCLNDIYVVQSFFLEIVAGLLMSWGFEDSWVLGLTAVGSSCQAVMSGYISEGAIFAWMVWLMEGCFLCPNFSFLMPLSLLPPCSYWRIGKILLHGPFPGDISLALQPLGNIKGHVLPVGRLPPLPAACQGLSTGLNWP